MPPGPWHMSSLTCTWSQGQSSLSPFHRLGNRLRNVPIMQCATDNVDLNLQSPCSCSYITALFPLLPQLLLPQTSLTPRAQITSQDSLFLWRVTGTTRAYTWKHSGWTGREAPDCRAVERGVGFPGGTSGKEPPASAREVRCGLQGSPLEEGVAAHPSILVWRIPCTEEPGRLHRAAQSQTQLR